jgi:hypothetical protein
MGVGVVLARAEPDALGISEHFSVDLARWQALRAQEFHQRIEIRVARKRCESTRPAPSRQPADEVRDACPALGRCAIRTYSGWTRAIAWNA